MLWFVSPDWRFDPQYQYGWAVPFLALHLLRLRREDLPPRLALSPGHASLVGGVMLLVAVPLAATVLLGVANPDWRALGWLAALAAVAATVAWFALVDGWGRARHFAFPILFFLSAVPWSRPVEARTIAFLMRANAAIAVELLAWLGVAAERTGHVIRLATGTVGIDEACSGIRSLQGALMVALFLGEYRRLSVARRMLLLGLALVIAAALNTVRALMLSYAAAHGGGGGVRLWHDPAGLTILVTNLVILWVVASRLGSRGCGVLEAGERRPETGERGLGGWVPGGGRAPVWLAVAAAAVIGASFPVARWWYAPRGGVAAPAPPWSVRFPEELPGFAWREIGSAVRADMRYEEARSAVWTDDGGRGWQAIWMRWGEGDSFFHRARMHDPSICLSAVGMRLLGKAGRIEVAGGGDRLFFDRYLFADRGRTVAVYRTLNEDPALLVALGPQWDPNSWRGRIKAAWMGSRQRGQQMLTVGIFGVPDLDCGDRLLRAAVPGLVAY